MLFDWVELVVIFVSAFVSRQYLLEVFTLALAVDAKDVLDIPGVVELPFGFEIGLDCYGKSELGLVQIDILPLQFIKFEVRANVGIMFRSQMIEFYNSVHHECHV